MDNNSKVIIEQNQIIIETIVTPVEIITVGMQGPAGTNGIDGTASYPSFTGNAAKVLTVNTAEDGVEWAVAATGGGSGGGINVIEYVPSLHEVVVDTVVGADFEPTRPHFLDDIPTSSWNPTTGVMGVANAAQTEGFPNNHAEYVGLRLTPSLYGMRGSFTIDASLCKDAWGFALLQNNYSGGFPTDLWRYLLVQHYKTVEDASLSQPQTFGWVLTELDAYSPQLWFTDPFNPQYTRSERGPIATKPQGVYTFHIGSVVDAYMEFSGFSYEQALEFFNTTFPPEQVAAILSTTLVYNADVQTILELKADTPYLHFFMNAYHKASQTGLHPLNPTSQLTITYDLEEVGNIPPAEAVDGDFLHLLGNAKLLGKDLASGDFVQLYDNKTKMIVHANLDNVDSVGSVNGQTGVVVLDADDVGATTQTYVDTQDNLIINSLTLKADTNYVDTQDGLLQDQIDLKADAIAVNQVLSTKADLVGGVIPSSQLPSYVDDVLNFPDLISFPSLGEDAKIYIAEDVNKTYRWGGSSYVEIGGGGVALGETSSTAYRGDRGKIAYDHSLSQGNPHNTTTSDINEGTKLFFTESRVNQTVLTGLNTSTATPALATDQLLAAIGKLQAQINNIAPPTWVSAASIGTTHSSFINVQFAKINGLLWIRGYCNTTTAMGAGVTLFLLTNPSYYLDISTTLFLPTTLGEITVFSSEYGVSKLIQLKTVPNSANKFSLHNSTNFIANEYNHIQPVALGKLLTP